MAGTQSLIKFGSPDATFSEKILFGLKKALRKLAKESAAKNESLVVKVDGEIREVPAKELLKSLHN